MNELPDRVLTLGDSLFMSTSNSLVIGGPQWVSSLQLIFRRSGYLTIFLACLARSQSFSLGQVFSILGGAMEGIRASERYRSSPRSVVAHIAPVPDSLVANVPSQVPGRSAPDFWAVEGKRRNTAGARSEAGTRGSHIQ